MFACCSRLTNSHGEEGEESDQSEHSQKRCRKKDSEYTFIRFLHTFILREATPRVVRLLMKAEAKSWDEWNGLKLS